MEVQQDSNKRKIQPAHIVRRGGIAASIWQRSNESGPYYDISLSRSWKSTKTQTQGYSSSFFSHNAAALAEVIEEASAWINSRSGTKQPSDTAVQQLS